MCLRVLFIPGAFGKWSLKPRSLLWIKMVELFRLVELLYSLRAFVTVPNDGVESQWK